MTDMNIMELILNFFIRKHEVLAEHLLKINFCGSKFTYNISYCHTADCIFKTK